MKSKINVKNVRRSKFTRFLFFLIGAVALACHSPLWGTVIFQENFDNSPPYTDGGAVPYGYGQINYGRWVNVNGTDATATTPTTVNNSPTRALELEKGGTGDASVIGYFGENNTASYTTTESINVRFAFNLADNTYVEMYVGANTAVLGLLNIGSGGGDTGRVTGNFNNTVSTGIPINLDEWYYIDILMSGSPADNGGYSFSVYESDGVTQVGATLSGAFFVPAESTSVYEYIRFINYGTANSSVYFDDISVTIVPEPGTFALLLTALAVGIFSRRRRGK